MRNVQLHDEGHCPLHDEVTGDDVNGKERVWSSVDPGNLIRSTMDAGVGFEDSDRSRSRPVDNSQKTSICIEQGGYVVFCAIVV